jgi:hypothetical protein
MYAQNVKASEQVAILGAINPSSQAAGAATSGWVSMADFQKVLAVVQTGALGASATVDAKIQQAKDNSGTGAKDVTGSAITQITGANNQQAEINLDAQQLDVEGGFGYVQLSVTVGTAASETAALVLGFSPRYAPASDSNAASVAEIVG